METTAATVEAEDRATAATTADPHQTHGTVMIRLGRPPPEPDFFVRDDSRSPGLAVCGSSETPLGPASPAAEYRPLPPAACRLSRRRPRGERRRDASRGATGHVTGPRNETRARVGLLPMPRRRRSK